MAEQRPPGATLQAGRVGRPHGLDGSFYVTAPRPHLLAVGARVNVAGRSAEVVRRAGTDRHPIVRLHGVEDRDQAQGLRGLALTVEARSAPALGEDEWWAHELEGCEVYDGARRVGVVARMIEYPSCEALEVKREEGADLLVPMVKDAIRSVRVAERRIEIDLGFVEEEPPRVQTRPREEVRDGD
jgi:16S rRNA processing protein RimM